MTTAHSTHLELTVTPTKITTTKSTSSIQLPTVDRFSLSKEQRLVKFVTIWVQSDTSRTRQTSMCLCIQNRWNLLRLVGVLLIPVHLGTNLLPIPQHVPLVVSPARLKRTTTYIDSLAWPGWVPVPNQGQVPVLLDLRRNQPLSFFGIRLLKYFMFVLSIIVSYHCCKYFTSIHQCSVSSVSEKLAFRK